MTPTQNVIERFISFRQLARIVDSIEADFSESEWLQFIDHKIAYKSTFSTQLRAQNLMDLPNFHERLEERNKEIKEISPKDLRNVVNEMFLDLPEGRKTEQFLENIDTLCNRIGRLNNFLDIAYLNVEDYYESVRQGVTLLEQIEGQKSKGIDHVLEQEMIRWEAESTRFLKRVNQGDKSAIKDFLNNGDIRVSEGANEAIPLASPLNEIKQQAAETKEASAFNSAQCLQKLVLQMKDLLRVRGNVLTELKEEFERADKRPNGHTIDEKGSEILGVPNPQPKSISKKDSTNKDNVEKGGRENNENTQRTARKAVTLFESLITEILTAERGKRNPMSTKEIVQAAILKYCRLAVGQNLAATERSLARYLRDIRKMKTPKEYARQLVGQDRRRK